MQFVERENLLFLLKESLRKIESNHKEIFKCIEIYIFIELRSYYCPASLTLLINIAHKTIPLLTIALFSLLERILTLNTVLFVKKHVLF